MSATVLLVEDYSAHRALLNAAVSNLGCVALEAADGREGLVLAVAHRPALVILDLILPDLDGVEVLRRLRQDPTTATIPVLIVTAVDSQARVVEALDAGADDYVTKPFEQPVLQARIKVLLRAARLQADLKQQVAQAEAVARMARSAGGELDDLCRDVAAALRDWAPATACHLYALRDEQLIGPFAARETSPQRLAVAPLLHNPLLGRVFCGEVPWQRADVAEIGPLAGGLTVGETILLPLKQGQQVVGVAVLQTPERLREARLRRLTELADSAAVVLLGGLERAARAASDTRYQHLFEQAGDGVVLIDPDLGTCREVNQALAGWASALPPVLIGRPFASLFAPEHEEAVTEALRTAVAGQRPTFGDVHLRGAGGERVPVEVTLRLVKHHTGRDVVAVVRDVRRRLEGEATGPRQDLLKLARTVRAINHEINNPLTCIVGLTQLLQLKLKALPEHLGQLDRILESADQINVLTRQLRQAAINLAGEERLEDVEATLDELTGRRSSSRSA